MLPNVYQKGRKRVGQKVGPLGSAPVSSGVRHVVPGYSMVVVHGYWLIKVINNWHDLATRGPMSQFTIDLTQHLCHHPLDLEASPSGPHTHILPFCLYCGVLIMEEIKLFQLSSWFWFIICLVGILSFFNPLFSRY